MRCPYCAGESAVIDTRDLDNGESIRRRRRCKQCDRRFTTYERVESVNVAVVKKNGDREPYDRDHLSVLLSLDTSSVDLHRPEVRRTDGDFALSWCRSFGAGRVFYTALGHRPEVWRDGRFRKHLLGGCTWAMSG